MKDEEQEEKPPREGGGCRGGGVGNTSSTTCDYDDEYCCRCSFIPFLTVVGVVLAVVGVIVFADGVRIALDAGNSAAELLRGDLGPVPSIAHTITGETGERESHDITPFPSPPARSSPKKP